MACSLCLQDNEVAQTQNLQGGTDHEQSIHHLRGAVKALSGYQFEKATEQYRGNKGIIRDERISLAGQHTRDKHPGDPRLIRFYDEKRKKTLVFLTNNFRLAAAAIARIYKSRWRIELFFKWIKQNLKIKSFLGTSRNAVMTQIWLAMCYYLLLTYIKYQTRYAYSLLQLGRIIRETLFDRKSLVDILTVTPEHMAAVRNEVLQGTLF